MKDPQKESGEEELNPNQITSRSEESLNSEENPKDIRDGSESRIQDDAGTGLFDLGVAIGGTGGGLVGNDNPRRNKQDDS